MTTNYFARTPDTPPSEDGLHIGQHANGSVFLFRAHPDRGLTNCGAWHEFLARPGVVIESDYGTRIPLSEFWPYATLRPADTDPPLQARFIGNHRREGEIEDEHGHPFQTAEFC